MLLKCLASQPLTILEPPLFRSTASTKEIEARGAYLMSALARRLSTPNPEPSPQIWVALDSSISPLARWLPTFITLEAQHPAPQATGLSLSLRGKVSTVTSTQIRHIERFNAGVRHTANFFSALGLYGFAIDLFATVLGNQDETGDGLFDRVARGWSHPYPIHETPLFLSFSTIFSAAPMLAALATTYAIHRFPLYQILSTPTPRFVEVSTPITPLHLTGTPQEPGLLFQTMRGVLCIHSKSLLTDGALGLLETLASNKGWFEFVIGSNLPPIRIRYTGQLVIRGPNLDSFSPLARCSGRLLELNPHTLPPRPEPSAEVLDVTYYSNINPPTHEELSTNPFALFVGRDREIERLKRAAADFCDAHRHELSPPSFGVLICDKPTASGEGRYGQGKTSLGEAALQEFQNLFIAAGYRMPGLLLRRSGSLATSELFRRSPSGPPLDSVFLTLYMVGSLFLLGTFIFLIAVLNAAADIGDENGASREFNAKSTASGAGIALAGGIGVAHLYQNYGSDQPHVLAKPSPIPSCIQISTTPPHAAWVGVKSPSKSPQNRYQPSPHTPLIPLVKCVLVESGAIDPQPDDPPEACILKSHFRHTVGAVLRSHSVLLGGDGPKIPVSTFFVLTSNRPKDKVTAELVDACHLVIELDSVVPFNAKVDTPKIEMQLKFENEKMQGLPWTQEALNAFVYNIQFPGTLPAGHVLIIRHYFEYLLPLINEMARTRGNNTYVSLQDFKEAWTTFIERYRPYLNGVLPSRISRDHGFKLPPPLERHSTAWA